MAKVELNSYFNMIKKITVISEGQTELKFAMRILEPFFSSRGILLTAPQVMQKPRHNKSGRGGVHSQQQLNDNVKTHLGDSSATIVTTLIDFYEFPSELTRTKNVSVEDLENQWRQEIRNSRFVPYLQKHEFEALLFSDPSQIEQVLNLKQGILDSYSKIPPEELNSTPSHHPARVLQNICIKYLNKPYLKTVDGIAIASQIGIEKIRSKCPRFSEWIDRLISECDK
jgi:hypothetical protein